MGNFESAMYKSGQWVNSDGSNDWDLRVSVHDSDIATIEYHPSGSAAGRFFLGFQPRDYFDDQVDHEPVDLASESEGFCNGLPLSWARRSPRRGFGQRWPKKTLTTSGPLCRR